MERGIGQQGQSRQRGLTIMEILVVVSISSIVLMALLRFLVAGYPLSKTMVLQQRSTETARVNLKRIVKSLREARHSDTGAYPLVATEPQRIVYYANVDSDPATEKVRLELSGSDLVRGVTKPTGDPLIYDQNNEVTAVIIATVRNGTEKVFSYYTGEFPVDTGELTPTDLTEVKYIAFSLLIDADPAVEPPAIQVKSQVQLRNLKTNLGQVVEAP
ncbi:MAG TPA: hypothetical protein DDW41_06065 [Candidatus Andersenbacteria bacterium]|nr:MAG: hypothetical protein UW94_C0005G0023 [Parcubacteria group bacterium GW2011_GWA2_45_14]HBE90743.1 hypothetical protein [Candidatus Andersenbacteria bacterium]